MRIDFYEYDEFYNNDNEKHVIETWTDHEMHLTPDIGDSVILKEFGQENGVRYVVSDRIVHRTHMEIYVE